MKNKIWYRTKCFILAAVLTGEILTAGRVGRAYAWDKMGKAEAVGESRTDRAEESANGTTKENGKKSDGIRMEQEIHWTDKENYRALVTVRVRGLRAWLAERQAAEEENQRADEGVTQEERGDGSSESFEENPGEETKTEQKEQIETKQGSAGEEADTEQKKVEEEGETEQKKIEEEAETEQKKVEEDAETGQKKTGEEGETGQKKTGEEAEIERKVAGEEGEAEGRRVEKEVEAEPRRIEEEAEDEQKQSGEETDTADGGSAMEAGDLLSGRLQEETRQGIWDAERKEAVDGPGDMESSYWKRFPEETAGFSEGTVQEMATEEQWERQIGEPPLLPEGTLLPPVEYEVVPVAAFVQLAQKVETVHEGFQENSDSENENSAQEIFLINMLSPYFSVEMEKLNPDTVAEEISVDGQNGERITLTRVVTSMDVHTGDAQAKELSPGEKSDVGEEEYLVEIPVILRELWRVPEEDVVYPACHYAVPELPEAESGVCLVAQKDGERNILAEAPSGFLPIDGAKSGFFMEVSDGGKTPVAGKTFRYQVTLENTGNVSLKEIRLESLFSSREISGTWEPAEGLTVGDSGRAILRELKVGELRSLFLLMELPESWEGELIHTVRVSVAKPGNSEKYIRQESAVQSRVAPLKVEFSVKKTADRKQAFPGDTIIYQICIKNTGERTLHSVLSTERFAKKNIYARFSEQEGVILSDDKTQALIPQILPGEVYSMEAVVALPEDLESGELVNQVIVTARETGKQMVQAEAGVVVEPAQAETVPTVTETPGGESSSATPGRMDPSPGPVYDNPKTGDSSRIGLWIMIMGAALTTGILIVIVRKRFRR